MENFTLPIVERPALQGFKARIDNRIFKFMEKLVAKRFSIKSLGLVWIVMLILFTVLFIYSV